MSRLWEYCRLSPKLRTRTKLKRRFNFFFFRSQSAKQEGWESRGRKEYKGIPGRLKRCLISGYPGEPWSLRRLPQSCHCGALRSPIACQQPLSCLAFPAAPAAVYPPTPVPPVCCCCLHRARRGASITREPLTHTRALPDRLGLLALPPAMPAPSRGSIYITPTRRGWRDRPPTPALVVQAVPPELVTQLLPLRPRAWRLRFPHAHRDVPASAVGCWLPQPSSSRYSIIFPGWSEESQPWGRKYSQF